MRTIRALLRIADGLGLGSWRLLLAFLVAISHLWARMLHGPAAYAVWGFYLLSGYLMTHVLRTKYGFRPRGLLAYASNRVLLRGPNNPMMAAAWLAVMKAGGVCVATMPLLRAKELTDIIQKAEVTHALCDRRLKDDLVGALPACPTLGEIRYWYDDAPDSVDARCLELPETFDTLDTAAEDPALIAFTSGTTGKPKGTMHFHRDVIAMCDCFPRSCLRPGKDDIFIGTPPLAFTFGLGGLLCFPLRFGASTALVERFTPETLLESAQKFKATILFTADRKSTRLNSSHRT